MIKSQVKPQSLPNHESVYGCLYGGLHAEEKGLTGGKLSSGSLELENHQIADCMEYGFLPNPVAVKS